MHEMLGNQNFLSNRFDDALSEYRIALTKNPTSLEVKKKIVLCLLHLNKLLEAYTTFHEIVMKDSSVIIECEADSNPSICRQMILSITISCTQPFSKQNILQLAMLWLYCDKATSIEYFKKFLEFEPSNNLTQKILDKLINNQITNTKDLYGNQGFK